MVKPHRDILARNLAILLFAIGIIIRFAAISSYPAGLNQDEALAGYEAYSLLHYGMDSHGYAFPVYFVAWGSGMNVLYSYLSIPFVGILGVTTLSVRLVQVIFSCLTLLVFHKFCKHIFSRRGALVALFLLVINPWHIMLSRWGLESNLVVFFVLCGFYFYQRGLDKPRYFIFSGIMYGLALYCYATAWVVIPLALVLHTWYSLHCKKLKISLQFILGGVALLAFALPLLLFLLVNVGALPEIRLPFISVPRLEAMRQQEYSFASLPQNISKVFGVLATQSDGWGHNSLEGFGIYYLFSWPFILYGMAYVVSDGWRKLKKRIWSPSVPVLLSVIAIIPSMMLMVSPNINRINTLHIFMLYFCAYGIIVLFRRYDSKITAALLAAYAVCFLGFAGSYFSTQKVTFTDGYQQALTAAVASDDEAIYVVDIPYPVLLAETKYPVTEYLQDVHYSTEPSAFMYPDRIGRYLFTANSNDIQEGSSYVFPMSDTNLLYALYDRGYIITLYNTYYYAIQVH